MKNKIGKYLIMGELGKGGMGIVYKGKDPYIGRVVAIKTIRMDLLDEAGGKVEAQKRFIREAQSAGNLSHSNIVTIYDVGEDEGLIYIAMEYIDGRSLESWLSSNRQFTILEIVSMIGQISEALDYAHSRGVIHRDIKPANILLDQENKVHIVDFGIARMGASTMTQTGMLMGTPRYMSPEQISGKKIDNRSDIFSLGAIIYELLTHQNPFSGDSITTVIYKVIHEEVPSVTSYNHDLPVGLDEVLHKALAKDPEKRYATCHELAEDFKFWGLGQVETLAEQRTLMIKPDQQPESKAASAEAAKIVPEKAIMPDKPVFLKQKKSHKALWVSLVALLILAIAGGAFFKFVYLKRQAEKQAQAQAALTQSANQTEAQAQNSQQTQPQPGDVKATDQTKPTEQSPGNEKKEPNLQPGDEKKGPETKPQDVIKKPEPQTNQDTTQKPENKPADKPEPAKKEPLKSDAAGKPETKPEIKNRHDATEKTGKRQDGNTEEVKRNESSRMPKIGRNDKGFREGIFVNNTVRLEIPEGEFRIGSPDNDGDEDEHPAHKVFIKTYWLAKYETTFDQYDAFCRDTGRAQATDDGWGRGRRPVINVSWHDASDYCRWLSQKSGHKFRLPTEAEWEKAAKERYPWGSKAPDATRANIKGAEDGYEHTAPVGSFPRGMSPYGVLDLAGNVWEWCYDWYDARYYHHSPLMDPMGPANGQSKVVRGGSWNNGPEIIRSANRSDEKQSSKLNVLGFRVVMEAEND